MDWVLEFYTKQDAWSGCYQTEITDEHHKRAAQIEEHCGPGPKRVLELGSGGGQAAAAMANLGHDVMAVDLVPTACEHARTLAASAGPGQVAVHCADFYTVELDGRFDAVCYWDGFGVGTDEEQRRLLCRIADWLTPEGCALIDIGTPWYAASVQGRGWQVGEGEREYQFDADGCRWLDRWWPIGEPEAWVEQSTRCYSPADLRLVLAGTELTLARVIPGGTVDWAAKQWLPSVPLGQAMSYLAVLTR